MVVDHRPVVTHGWQYNQQADFAAQPSCQGVPRLNIRPLLLP